MKGATQRKDSSFRINLHHRQTIVHHIYEIERRAIKVTVALTASMSTPRPAAQPASQPASRPNNSPALLIANFPPAGRIVTNDRRAARR